MAVTCEINVRYTPEECAPVRSGEECDFVDKALIDDLIIQINELEHKMRDLEREIILLKCVKADNGNK